MVDIIKYSQSQFDTIVALHMSNDYDQLDTITPDNLPALGYVAYDMATPIAAGFLRMVEGNFAQIDTLVSNKALSAEMRNDGITEVIFALTSAAKELKLKGIVSFSKDKGTLLRAETLGFRTMPHSVIVLSLEVSK